LRASIPDRISGAVEITIGQSDQAGLHAQELEVLLSNWARAVEVGFFGPGRLRLQGAIQTQGHGVSGRFELVQLSQAAFHVLSAMVRRSSEVSGHAGILDILYEGEPILAAPRMAIPALPQSIPFVVEYPGDLKPYLRVEMEFRDALAPLARDAIFDAFSIWDMLIDTFNQDQQDLEDERHVDCQSRLLSPAIVEHEVDGYYASFECLHYVIWMGLRLHQRLIIDRITFE
jgi:hypothetical protein